MTKADDDNKVDPGKTAESESADFVRARVANDQKTRKYGGRVATRFPPEPNGYLHIGHAKSICLNFGIAAEFGGECHLRFDDTNPTTEDMEFVESIQRDVRWLGFDWGEHLYFASDYFQRLYEFALKLIRDGKAYVDSATEEEIREARGTIAKPGTPTRGRSRSVQENLALFESMRSGELADGTHVLRAKIDLAAKNMKMRDPLLLRIRRGAHHYRTGDTWNIYPFYDFAHCLSDAVENITHSVCTLEFENNRELYDWVLDAAGIEHPRPEQTEFARLNLTYTVMSKRKLLRLVTEKHVAGWDDPRMPTLSGMRRRGVTPSAIRRFCDEIGVARTHNVIDLARLEHVIRDELNPQVPRVLCVLRPLEIVIDNYPEDQVEHFDAPLFPRDVPKEGTRSVPFSRTIYIDQDDFAEEPPKGWFRLAPGSEVRLRYAYLIKCTKVVKNEHGEIERLHCTYDPASRGGNAPDGRVVKGTIHWVSAPHAVPVEVRLYDRLFKVEVPDGEDGDFLSFLNPESLDVLTGCRLEPSMASAALGDRVQFERQGYFIVDQDTKPGALVFNRTVTLRDTWAKRVRQAGEQRPASPAASPIKPAVAREVEEPDTTSPAPEPDRVLSPEQAEGAERLVARGVDVRQAQLIASREGLLPWFDEAVAVHDDAAEVAKWVVNELVRVIKDRPLSSLPCDGAAFGELVAMVARGDVSALAAKDVLADMVEGKGRPAEIVARRGLQQINSDDAVATLVDEVLAQHPDDVARFREGKTALLGFFVGLAMRASKGKANPALVKQFLEKRLSS